MQGSNRGRSELETLAGAGGEGEGAGAAAGAPETPTRRAVDTANARNREADETRSTERARIAEANRDARQRSREARLDDGTSVEEIEEAQELARKIAEIRATRVQWASGLSQKLALPKRRGYHRHWFNDVGTRVDDAKASGWAHIKGQDGKPIMRTVGSARSGQPLVAYAMELPMVIWLEDLDAKNAKAEEVLDSTRKNPFKSPPGLLTKQDTNKFYSPVEDTGRAPLEIHKGQ